MPHVVDYATPPQQRPRPVWLIVLATVTIMALLGAGLYGYALMRQRQAAMRALQLQQQAARVIRQKEAALQQQEAQTRPAEPGTQPGVEQP